uniref:Uncharacterized protein n=1 Tax=Fagus sylvatica TaxID=28930 RepID=A0A2N9IF91_FAGSY
MTSSRFLFSNGVVLNSHDTPPITTFLESHPGEELSVTTLVSGNSERLSGIGNVDVERVCEALDVYVYVGSYVPLAFGDRENSARLAVVGHGRDVANAKYSDWVRLRKPLEKWSPSSVTELLLSNDGDQILEGCRTNFFVVCRKAISCAFNLFKFSFHSASPNLNSVCLSKGISFREVAPSWSEHETWEEAFITNSLRLLQHVETIQVPSSWESLHSTTWEEISWEEKQFKDGPGMITAIIQKTWRDNGNDHSSCSSGTERDHGESNSRRFSVM